jgi:hypothetical protein
MVIDPQTDADSRPYDYGSEEGVKICAVVGTEKIEKARPVANAARQKRLATVKDNTPLERLEDELLAKENRCLELRQQIEAKKQEVPVRRDSDGDSLQALEAKLLSKEEECETELETLILLILDL